MDMPIVQPVLIPTKGLPWYRRAPKAFRTRKWTLVENYRYYSPTLKYALQVPAPFIFDGASVPRPLWPLMDPTGILFIGALFHDFGYRYRGLLIDQGTGLVFQPMTRFEVDKVFEIVVVDVNGMKVFAKLAKWGVNLGGFFAWKNNYIFNDYPHLEV